MAAWEAANPEPPVGIKDVADHFDHIKQVAGVDHVGIGGDFDGTGGEHIQGLEDVSKYPDLLAELARRGWTDDDLRKVASGNILRVLTDVETGGGAAAEDAPAEHQDHRRAGPRRQDVGRLPRPRYPSASTSPTAASRRDTVSTE